MIAIDGIRFDYGKHEFRMTIDSLRVESGERVACIGPSGTGKTTLVNLIAGILVPSAGAVRVADAAVSGMTDADRRAFRVANVGLVFQEFELLDHLSALENILLPYHVTRHLVLDAAVVARSRALADSMGISHALARGPRGLSQGERQRVAICRALVTEPKLVMCDEPTGNLDPATAGTTLDLLFDRVSERAATLLMVTHNHGILGRFDRVLDITDLGSAS